ncbi:MAG TPA: GDSL-type esterase/lipase family protein [Vicinamibacterales bacterium]|nr:GDSL-type esterase/lipase family protein [Vicinamibacterales bacterium]
MTRDGSSYGYRPTSGLRGPLMQSPAGDLRAAIYTDDWGLRVSSTASVATTDRGDRILVLGDSQTFGAWVEGEAAYPTVLDRLFEDEANPVRVLNAGVPGYGTADALAYYSDRLHRLQARLVVLGLFLGNDVADNVRAAVSRPMELNIPLKSRLRRLHFYRLLAESYDSLLVRLGFRSAGFYSGTALLEDPPQPWVDEGWQRTRTLLSELADAVRSHDARLVVVVLPFGNQVVPHLRQSWEGDSLNGPQRRVAAMCREIGLQCIDVLVALQAEADRGVSVFFPERDIYSFAVNFIHLTPAGHDAVARAMAKALEANR